MKLLNNIDPSPFFIMSLIPYLVFLFYAQKINLIPKETLLGFRLTILFVVMTIIFAIIALFFYYDELTNIDYLHGSAEAFLTLSDALIVVGLIQLLKNKQSKKS